MKPPIRSPRSLDDTRNELEALASDLRTLADHAERGVHSLDRIVEAETTIKDWAPVALLIAGVCAVVYAATRRAV